MLLNGSIINSQNKKSIYIGPKHALLTILVICRCQTHTQKRRKKDTPAHHQLVGPTDSVGLVVMHKLN